MRLYYLILLLMIISDNFFPQNKNEINAEIEKYLQESCKYECGLYGIRDSTLKDTILVDQYFSFGYSNYPKYRIECIDTLNKYLTLNGKNKTIDSSLILYYVTYHGVDDAPYFPMLLVNNTYGVLFSFMNEKKHAAFNLVLNLLPEFELKTEIEVREYIDFILRLYFVDDIGPYRINKPDDVWLYPQYHYRKYQDFDKGLGITHDYWPYALRVFNKEMLVENVAYNDKNITKDIKNFKNYKKSIDTLQKIIKPINIVFDGEVIQAETFIAHKYTGDIEFWQIKMNNRGYLLDVQRKAILKKVGFDLGDFW